MFTTRSIVSLCFVAGMMFLPLVAASRQTPSASAACAESSAIQPVGRDRYRVRREEVQSMLGNSSLMSRSARIVPEMRDEVMVGFRLFSVSPCGLAARLGFQNGDVVRELNGLPISTPQQALEAHVRLRHASEIQVTLERDGRPRLLTYVLR